MFSRLRQQTPAQQQVFLRRCFRQQIISESELWEILTADHSPVNGKTAIGIFEALGFEPFAGFPLRRMA